MKYDIWIEFTPLDERTPDDITHIHLNTLDLDFETADEAYQHLVSTHRYKDNILVTPHTDELD
jgi:hypothetical protein